MNGVSMKTLPTNTRLSGVRSTNALLLVCLSLLLAFSCFALSASAQIAVVGSLSHDDEASPGSRYSGTIEIHNSGTDSRQAKIFQTDYSFSYDGSNNFGAPGSEKRSNADWISFSPAFVTVPPGETVPVAYEVVVPADSSELAGTYWSILMIEDVPTDSPESTVEAEENAEIRVGVREVFRYAVQLATHIRTNEDYQIEFVGVGLEDSLSPQTLRVAVQNSGNVFMNPAVWIEVFDASGEKKAKIESKSARLYPSTSVSHLFDLSGFEHGEYEVLVVVDAGEENIFGAQYSLAL